MVKSNLIYFTALASNPAIGSKTILKLEKYFGSLDKLWKNKSTNNLERLQISPNILAQIRLVLNNSNPETELEKLNKLNIKVIDIHSKEYPKLLQEIPDPPAILYVKGNLDFADDLTLAVVGARKYSIYGKKVVEDVIFKLARLGIVIVSGLALGIDAIAHKAALDAKGKTLAILGCGLDQVYPTSNTGLARKIIDTGGAIISEYPPGTPPYKSNFPLRNRIIAGISLGVLIIEAAEKSGTLLTAKAALDYNRQLFAIPGSIYSATSVGVNNLIKYGAKPVTNYQDITSELNIKVRSEQIKSRKIFPQSHEEAQILDHLSEDIPLHVDKLAKLTKLNIATINSMLTYMEIKGMVKNIGGNNYIINN